MSIMLNGRPYALRDDTTLIDVIAETTGRRLRVDGMAQDGENLGVAAAVDAVVIPRSRWQETSLEPGQTVELITAMQGG